MLSPIASAAPNATVATPKTVVIFIANLLPMFGALTPIAITNVRSHSLPDGRAITASLHHGVSFTRRGGNLLAGRENDRWSIGFFHFGLSEPLLAGLTALDVNRRSEGEVEAFYNLAITPWLRLSADLQLIDPWNPSKSRATYAALRLQTKF